MPFLKDRSKLLHKRTREIEDRAKRNGLRHVVFNTLMETYVGEWKDDKKCGKGVIRKRTGTVYEGDVFNNRRHGQGMLTEYFGNRRILVYYGQFVNGKKHGNCLKLFREDGFYLGKVNKGKRHGYGEMWFHDGSFYDGNWINDRRNGNGMFIRADGNRYEGQWVDDKRHGRGKFVHLNTGQMQTGIWKDDMPIMCEMFDIPFRQCAQMVSNFPILTKEISDEQIKIFEIEAFEGLIEPCLQSKNESQEVLSIPTLTQ